MSRHTLPIKTGKIIIGYDRPLDHFFIQEWTHRGIHPKLAETEIDLDDVERHYGKKLPKDLRDTLVNEVLGKSDTNACKTWEWPDSLDEIRKKMIQRIKKNIKNYEQKIEDAQRQLVGLIEEDKKGV